MSILIFLRLNRLTPLIQLVSQESQRINFPSVSEPSEIKESGGTCSLDDCNLVLDVILVKDCVMKGLRASLIIESLKEVSKLAKTEPDENEMDNSFDGHFTSVPFRG